MAYTQPYSAYKETAVKTAGQGKLIVMLYEAILKELKAAVSLYSTDDSIQSNVIETYHNRLLKAQQIITELMISLDMHRGGEIAQNLMSLYSFFNRELMNVSLNHDKGKLIAIQNLVGELHSSWAVAITQAPEVMTRQSPSLDING